MTLGMVKVQEDRRMQSVAAFLASFRDCSSDSRDAEGGSAAMGVERSILVW